MDFWKWVSGLTWGSFIPDLIVALLTGLLVGFLLWRYERRVEAAAGKREAQREWDAMFPRIAPMFAQPYEDRGRPFGVIEIFVPIRRIQPMLDDKPTDTWATTLDTDMLRDLHTVYSDSYEVEYLQQSMSAIIERESNRLLPLFGKPVEGMDILTYREWIRARADGATPLARPGVSEPMGLAELIFALPEWQRLYASYQFTAQRMVLAFNRLHEEFGAISRRRRRAVGRVPHEG